MFFFMFGSWTRNETLIESRSPWSKIKILSSELNESTTVQVELYEDFIWFQQSKVNVLVCKCEQKENNKLEIISGELL